MKPTLLTILALALTGCARDSTAPQVDVSALRSQLGEATERADTAERARQELVTAQDAKNAAETERAGKTRAVFDELSVDLGAALYDMALLNVKMATEWYKQVQANPELRIWLANQRAAYESGKRDEVSRSYDAAMADGKAMAGRIGALTEQVEQAKATESKARTEAIEARKSLANEVENHAKQIEDAKRIERDRIAAETRAAQVRMANMAGGICGVAALACVAGAVWLSAAAAKFMRGAALAGVLCAVCFGFARFAASPFFVPVTASVCGLLLAGWIAWEIRGALRKREADASAATHALVAQVLVDELDAAYDTADADHQVWMQDGILKRLAEHGPQYSAAVHEIKASIKLAESLDKKD